MLLPVGSHGNSKVFSTFLAFLYNSLAPGGLGLHRDYSGLIIYLVISLIVIAISILINGKNWLRKPSKQK